MNSTDKLIDHQLNKEIQSGGSLLKHSSTIKSRKRNFPLNVRIDETNLKDDIQQVKLRKWNDLHTNIFIFIFNEKITNSNQNEKILFEDHHSTQTDQLSKN